MVTRAAWLRQLEEHPDRPRGRQHRQFDALVALADLVDVKTGKGDVSVLELAMAAAASERTARRALAWAMQAGMIQRSCRGRGRGTATSAVLRLAARGPQDTASSGQLRTSGGQFEGSSGPFYQQGGETGPEKQDQRHVYAAVRR